jgi:hypothetical protein
MASSPFRSLNLEGATSVTAGELRQALAKQSKTSKGRTGKYNAKVVETAEGRFDSITEYKRYLALSLEARAGLIKDLRLQVRYPLVAGGIHISTYVADFVYERDGQLVVEDSKGFRTREYLQKRRLMREIHGITILETGRPGPSKRKKPKAKTGG